MISDLQQGSRTPAAGFSDYDLERLSRVLIDQSIDKRRDHVDVSFEDGWATVSGEVATTRRKCDVERHVRSLAGVKGITSHIEITAANSAEGVTWPIYGE
jgi:osmotically-inducible protein OsmY